MLDTLLIVPSLYCNTSLHFTTLLRSLENLWTFVLGSRIIYRRLVICFASKIYVHSTGDLHVWYNDPPSTQNGAGWLSWYSDSLRAGRFGIDSRWGARFSAPVQTGHEAHPASCTMGTGSFPGVKRPGHGVDHQPQLTPRLKKEYSYTSSPPLGLRSLL